jgi:hypothetical protein
MARPFHIQVPHHRNRSERAAPQGAGYLVILLLALLAAVWMNQPSVASLLPTHPPG